MLSKTSVTTTEVQSVNNAFYTITIGALQIVKTEVRIQCVHHPIHFLAAEADEPCKSRASHTAAVVGVLCAVYCVMCFELCVRLILYLSESHKQGARLVVHINNKITAWTTYVIPQINPIGASVAHPHKRWRTAWGTTTHRIRMTRSFRVPLPSVPMYLQTSFVDPTKACQLTFKQIPDGLSGWHVTEQ